MNLFLLLLLLTIGSCAAGGPDSSSPAQTGTIAKPLRVFANGFLPETTYTYVFDELRKLNTVKSEPKGSAVQVAGVLRFQNNTYHLYKNFQAAADGDLNNSIDVRSFQDPYVTPGKLDPVLTSKIVVIVGYFHGVPGERNALDIHSIRWSGASTPDPAKLYREQVIR